MAGKRDKTPRDRNTLKKNFALPLRPLRLNSSSAVASLRPSAERLLPASRRAGPSQSACAQDQLASRIPARKESRTQLFPKPPAAEPPPRRSGHPALCQFPVRYLPVRNRAPPTQSHPYPTPLPPPTPPP